MEKQKTYTGIKFPISTLEDALTKFSSLLEEGWKGKYYDKKYAITTGDERIAYDSFEEFLNAYLKADRYFLRLIIPISGTTRMLSIDGNNREVDVTVDLPRSQDIDAVMYVFERDKSKNVLSSKTMTKEPAQTIVRERMSAQKLFIGHGHDEQWRKLKDHLLHQQKYEVMFYEEAPRAGLVTTEVLEKMLAESDIALLVFTGEVIHSDGTVHARDNVIHELGLFQGHLGFQRAIMLLEEGVYEPSNVHGINQIRFAKDRLHEKYGDIVAIIRKLRQE